MMVYQPHFPLTRTNVMPYLSSSHYHIYRDGPVRSFGCYESDRLHYLALHVHGDAPFLGLDLKKLPGFEFLDHTYVSNKIISHDKSTRIKIERRMEDTQVITSVNCFDFNDFLLINYNRLGNQPIFI